MKAIITNTDKIIEMPTTEARKWNGITEKGVKFTLFVAAICVDNNKNTKEFEKDLKELSPPPKLFDFRLF